MNHSHPIRNRILRLSSTGADSPDLIAIKQEGKV